MISIDDRLDEASPWRLVTCNCSLFAQSRQLRHSITGEWMTALFDELTARPRDMIYSIAFALTFLPLHNLTGLDLGDDADTSRFIAARELYDLLDDSLRLDDDLSFDQLLRSRAVPLDTFVQSNVAYIKLIQTRRELSNRLERRDQQRRGIVESNAQQPSAAIAGQSLAAKEGQSSAANAGQASAAIAGQSLAANGGQSSAANGGQSSAANARQASAAIEFDLNDEIEIRRVLQTLNDETCLPLPLNIVCSRVTRMLNVDALVNSIIHGNSEQSSRADSDTINVSIDDEGASRLTENFSPEHMFLRYAPIVYRYEKLLLAIREIERTRNVRITPIYLPHMSVWQTGSSQLLWVMMHTLAALSVERRNVYIMRFMVLLQNLSFFVWCGECAAHWENNRGDEFFAQLDRLAEEAKRQLPIDLVLMRVHNQIAFNTNRALSSWTVGQLVLDYREFVRRALTKPAASMCNRPHVSAWWKRRRERRSQSPPRRPRILNEDQLGPRLLVRSNDRERPHEAYDRETYEPFYVRDQSPLELIDSLTGSASLSLDVDNYEIIKRALGDWLLCALWRSVSTNAPIGGGTI